MRLDFRRIQFTPDLVPSDITGSEVMEEDRAAGTRAFRFVEGPVFANVVLADEINRAPPRTQAALLEAMQEHAVSAAGRTMRLPEPFFVLATQNPIEQEGTYPLPEAQLDRFLFDVRVGYPAPTTRWRSCARPPARPRRRSSRCSAPTRRSPSSGSRAWWPPASRCSATRRRSSAPRARATPARRRSCAAPCAGARGRAPGRRSCSAPRPRLLAGRYAVAPEDVRRVAAPVLRHRVLPTFAAEAEGVDVEQVVAAVVDAVAAPRSGVGV
jgi:MoxR-like ATPase